MTNPIASSFKPRDPVANAIHSPSGEKLDGHQGRKGTSGALQIPAVGPDPVNLEIAISLTRTRDPVATR